jgi:hypothetical protein
MKKEKLTVLGCVLFATDYIYLHDMQKTILLLTILFCCGCSNTVTNQLDFPQTDTLNYSPLITDESLILKPLTMAVFDSIFFICDPYNDYHFAVINAKQNTLLFRGGNKGNCVDEFLYPVVLDKLSDNVLQIVDCAAKKVGLYNVQDILRQKTFNSYQTTQFKDIPLKDGEFIDFLYYLNDHTLIAIGFFFTSKYALCRIDSNGHIDREYILDFPSDDRHHHENESQITKYTAYQGILHFNVERNVVLYHSPLAFYYEVFNVNDPHQKLSGAFEPIDYISEDKGRAVLSDKNKSGFVWGGLSSTNVYLLFAGRDSEEYGSDAWLSNQILVWDYQGRKIIKYYLNRDVFSFVIDNKSQKIYAIVMNPETEQFEIGFFHLKNIKL